MSATDEHSMRYRDFDAKNPDDDTRKALDAQFDTADLDMSGKLSYDEFR